MLGLERVAFADWLGKPFTDIHYLAKAQLDEHPNQSFYGTTDLFLEMAPTGH
jgi:hypothetical protein